MVASSVNARPFTSAFYTLLANAGLANGVLVSDDDNAVAGKFLVRYGTKAQIDLLVLDVGEVAITTDTDEIRIGDGVTAGGLSHSNSSPSCVVVAATGTALENGAALRAAYTVAAALTPNGSAISSTNRAYVRLEPGVYNITGGAATFNLASNVAIIGSGSAATTIVCDGTSCIFHNAAVTSVLKGLTLSSSTQVIRFTGNLSYVLDWDDLYLSVGSGVACTGFSSSNATLSGNVRRVKTDGKSLLGGAISITLSARIEDCEAGDTSFGSGTSIGTAGTLTGGIYRTRMFGTTCYVKVNCVMKDCDWSDAIRKVDTAAEIYHTIIRAALTGVSIGNNGSSVTAKAIFGNLMAGTIGNGVSQGLTTSALDVNGNAPTSGIT